MSSKVGRSSPLTSNKPSAPKPNSSVSNHKYALPFGPVSCLAPSWLGMRSNLSRYLEIPSIVVQRSDLILLLPERLGSMSELSTTRLRTANSMSRTKYTPFSSSFDFFLIRTNATSKKLQLVASNGTRKSQYFFRWGETVREIAPCLHHWASLVGHLASTISGFHVVRDLVRQRHLGKFTWKASSFSNPITERTSKAVWHGWATRDTINKTFALLAQIRIVQSLHRCAQGHIR